MTRPADNLPTIEALPAPLQQRLAELLEQCLVDLEQGRAPDVDRLTASEPELAEPLKTYLGSLNFLQRAAAGFSPLGRAAAGPAGTAEKQLGDYQILREIGRGGMGVVYEARQISLDRCVALKVLPLAGLLDQKQIARFQKEARAAAQLHHPHIVPIFAVGCERGVHYYAMQYIDGQPLDLAIGQLRAAGTPAGGQTARAKGSTLRADSPAAGAASGSHGALSTAGSVRDRAYFRTVARLGIEAAAALQHAHECGIIHRDVKPSNLLLDGQGQLWVTDFGLARFQAETQRTTTGDVVGTLRYMSPEQAAGKSAFLDPRTDVYSLGITLYELLTLEVPFAGGDRVSLLRRIADEEPASPRRVNPAIPLDLETIVLKAIAKAREQRDGTAQDLGDDLQRFLDGRPTLARRPTPADRAVKWIKRHQRSAAVGVALMAVALLGLAASTLLILRAHAQTRAALAAADAHYRQARRVVDRFATRHAEQLANLPGAEPLRQELLGDALQYYQEFIRTAGDDPALRADLAVTQFKIGGIVEQIGDRPQALEAYRQARQLFQRLADESPATARCRGDFALCSNNIGLLLAQAGRSGEAKAAYREAIGLLEQLSATAGDRGEADKFRNDLALCYGNLALLEGQTDRPAEAEASYRAAIEIQRQLATAHPQEAKYSASLALSYNNLSFLQRKLDPSRAERYCREAIAMQEKAAAAAANVPAFQSDLALSYNNLGALENQAGRRTDSRQSYLKAIDLQRQLMRRAPAVLQYRRDLAISYNNLGRVDTQLNDPRRAQESFREACRILEELVHDHPAELTYRSDLGGVLNNLAKVLEQLGRPAEAVTTYAKAIEHQRYALDHAPQIARFREFLSQQYDNYARLLRAQKRGDEALDATAARAKLWAATAQPPAQSPN